ncbi:MAG: hypothetical protein ACREID_06565, partial [Planctomycetota bacterium]
MKTTTIRFSLLALVAGALTLSSTAGAEGWFKELDDPKEVTLGEVLRHPHDFVDVAIEFEAYFDSMGKSFNPYYTRFTEELYGNFAAWPMNARLYEKRDYQHAFPLLFVARLNPVLKKVRELDRFTPIVVTGCVRDVFRGQPWIEVGSFKRHGDGLTQNDVRNVVAGDAYFGAGRYDEAAKHYHRATRGDAPDVVKVDLLRRLADA